MKRYLVLSVITMVVSVAILRVANFGKAETLNITQSKTTSSPDQFSSPQAAGPTFSCSLARFYELPAQLTVGDTYDIRVYPGSCDSKLTNMIIRNAGGNYDTNSVYIGSQNMSVTKSSDGFFHVPWHIKEAGNFPSANLQATTDYSQTGATTFSLIVNPAVANKPCPIPSFITPSNGATLSGTATLQTTYDTASYGVIGVVFRYDTRLIGTSTATSTVPGKIRWDTTSVANGSHTVTAQAYCKDGYDNTSPISSVGVRVSNLTSASGTSGSTGTNTGSATTTDTSGTTVIPTDTSGDATVSAQTQQQLLAEPAYREVIATTKTAALTIISATPQLDQTKGVKSVAFRGKAKANTKYKLFVFSQPKQLDFTSDKDGNWSVEMKDSLPSGQHEAYVVLNDKNGKPIQRSSAISFLIPTAEAAKAAAVSAVAPSQSSIWKLYALYSGLTVLFSIVTFAIYETIKRRMSQRASVEDQELPPPTVIPPSTPPTSTPKIGL